MPTFKESIEKFQPNSIKEWREWLEKNYDRSVGVWLVKYKKEVGKNYIDYAQAVEEALCYGWIDSVANKVDDERNMLMFTPRKPKSPWSRLNKTRIEKLIKEGRMKPQGLKLIEEAKKDGSWFIYDEIEDLIEPKDLKKSLDENKIARENWNKFSPSFKKGILWKIKTSKTPETRSKRIKEVIEKAALNQKAFY